MPATPGVVLCIATGAGLVAVMARALWARQEARGSGAMVALARRFGLFCYTALLSSQVDRLPGVVTYVACAALVFVIVADRATRVAPGIRRRRPPRVRGPACGLGLAAALPAVVGAALAVVIPLAASPALATLKVDALPFPPPPGGTQGAGPRHRGRDTGGSGGGGGGTSATLGVSGCAPSTSSTT